MTAKRTITRYEARPANKFTKYSLDQITPFFSSFFLLQYQGFWSDHHLCSNDVYHLLYMVRMARTKVLSRERNQKEGESYLCPFPGSK